MSESKKKRPYISVGVKFTITYAVLGLIAPIIMGVTMRVRNDQAVLTLADNTQTELSYNQATSYSTIVSNENSNIQLICNTIGYNAGISNYLPDVLASDADKRTEAQSEIQEALIGTSVIDGDSISGTLDYLKNSNHDIYDIRIYTPYITKEYYDISGAYSNLLFPTDENPLMQEMNTYFNEETNRDKTRWYYEENTSAAESSAIYIMHSFGSYAATETEDIAYLGFIRFELRLESIIDLFGNQDNVYSGFYLFDEKNDLVGAKGPRNSQYAPISKEVLNHKDQYLSDDYQALTVHDKEKFVTVMPLKNDWTLINYSSTEVVRGTLRQNRYIVLFITLAVIVVVTVIMIIPSRLLSRRIVRLRTGADQIRNGNYDYRVRDTHLRISRDEITVVGDSFNTMADTVKKTLEDMVATQDGISESFSEILEAKSGESGHHVKRVSEYSALLAKAMGYSDKEVHDIRIASMMHDVGKIMVPNTILEKPGKLTDEEFSEMKKHVIYGEKMLSGLKGSIMEKAAKIAGGHHERWDGRGYMKGLKGDEIPQYVQIVSVADVFDALTSKRSYKDPWPMNKAYNEIVSQKGKQFSPAAVDAFIEVYPEMVKIHDIYKDEAIDALEEKKKEEVQTAEKNEK